MNTPRPAIEPESITPAGFEHFAVRTSNVPAMRDWYVTFLNARVAHENPAVCFVTYDDEHHRVALIHVPNLEPPAPNARGVVHVAYSFKTLRQLLSTYVRLRDQGIVPFRPIHHGPTVSMYYRDPDGNAVELQVDAFSTKEGAIGFMNTAEFAANPIGVMFDPEVLLRDYEAGVPEEVLFRRPSGDAARSMAASG